ncbi:MAG: hypothetical protein A2Y48_08870 [Nitrospirae bacterium RIFCSPLOW2_12_42_9]|nr:MAG: hypothetical protein A3D21_05285 [Nitrospirae bacterium RIFCSPHIGHO2_02_FULL_42_12]OGW57668.1 MAG: hypothetical protein A2Y48_08870 [Nitrospirae bacterium RIFCSPLOW2_12_42_9]HBI22748.1 hypothetical protein [Nitrospiraceae bacterium]
MDRRKFPRISLLGEIIIKAKDSGEQLQGYAINISRGGVAFYSEKLFNINSELSLTLFFKYEDEERREEVSCIVRWIKPVGNIFAIGVQFENIRKEKQPMIFKYLENNEYIIF